MPGTPGLERLLRRDRLITIVAVMGLCAAAWLYLLAGAGLAMSPWEMTRLGLLPGEPSASGMPDMTGMRATPWNFGIAAAMVAMWWFMMIAMMSPSAAPTILLYARVHRQAAVAGRLDDAIAPTGAFAAGYLLVWLGFSLAATALHWMLEHHEIVSAMPMGSRSRWLSGGILILAGLYQLTPFKKACLSHCRAPAAFLSRHWRPGQAGALRLGAMHGAYCVGCCWMLMALLFVGGVMNLVWIVLLTLMVLAEKLLRAGQWIGRGFGIALIGWGMAILLR